MKTFFSDSKKASSFVEHLFQKYYGEYLYFHTHGKTFCRPISSVSRSVILDDFCSLDLGDVFEVEYERNGNLYSRYYMVDTATLRSISYELYNFLNVIYGV